MKMALGVALWIKAGSSHGAVGEAWTRFAAQRHKKKTHKRCNVERPVDYDRQLLRRSLEDERLAGASRTKNRNATKATLRRYAPTPLRPYADGATAL